jgi:hypothetical protein
MFSFFKKKSTEKDIPPLYFKSNEAAFEFAKRTFGLTPDDSLVAEQVYFARLLEDYHGVNHEQDTIYIELPSDKLSLCFALFPKNHPNAYPKNTLIFFKPIQRETIDSIESWLGLVYAVVEPVFHVKKGWKFAERFLDE